MKVFFLSLFVILGPAGAGAVYADSDGYYCVGRGKGQKVSPAFLPQRNLGMLSPAIRNGKPERVSLGMKQDGGQFVLEMTGQPIPNEQCLMALTTRIVETDRNGREIRERIIYQGRGSRDCGGRPSPSNR